MEMLKSMGQLPSWACGGIVFASSMTACAVDPASSVTSNRDSLGISSGSGTLASAAWRCGTQKILFDGQCRVAAYFENFVSDGFELAIVTKAEPNEDNGFVLWEQTADGLELNVVAIVPEAAASTSTGRNGYRIAAMDKTSTSFDASSTSPSWSFAVSAYTMDGGISATHHLYEQFTSSSRTCESGDLATLEDAGNCSYVWASSAEGGFCGNASEIIEKVTDLYCEVGSTSAGLLVGTAVALSTGGTVPIGVAAGAATAVALRGACHALVDVALAYGTFESAAQSFCEDTSETGGDDGGGIDLQGGPATMVDYPIGDAGDQCSQLSGQEFEFNYSYDDGEGITVTCAVVEASDCETESDGTCTCDFTPVEGETCDGSRPEVG